MAHDHDGTHDAIEAFFREGTSLAFKLVQHRQTLQQRIMQELREADRHSEQLDLLRSAALKHAQAGITGQKVMSAEWWDKTTPGEKLKTYADLREAATDTPMAAAGVKFLNAQIKEHYGFDPESLIAAGVPDDEIESKFAEHVARGQEAQSETRPSGFEQPMSAGAGERLEQAEAVVKGAGLDELAVQGLAEIHQLGLSRALSDVSHIGDIHDVVESARSEGDEPQARKANLGAEQAAQRDQGR